MEFAPYFVFVGHCWDGSLQVEFLRLAQSLVRVRCGVDPRHPDNAEQGTEATCTQQIKTQCTCA